MHASDFLYCPAGFATVALKGWLNRDPLGESGGANLYVFVENNPAAKIDPTGLEVLAGVSPHY